MRLTRLVLTNFISYEELDYIFETKPLLVQGINLTDDGQKTNGVGKSVIPTAIEQCIAGSNSRGVLDNDLIMFGKQQGSCELYVECDHRKERIHINNILNLKSSNQYIVKIQKYGESTWEPAPYSTSPEGKKWVEKWFGISKEDLFNYFIINNTRFKSFFASSNTEKVALVNRFSDASIVQGIENIDISELEEQLEGILELIGIAKGKVELTEQSIETETNRDFKEEKKEEEEKFNEQIETIEEEIEELKQVIIDRNLTKPSIEKNITLLTNSAFDNETKKKSIEKEIGSIKKEVESALKKVQEAEELVNQIKPVDFKKEKEVFESQKSEQNEAVKVLKTDKQKKEALKTQVLTLLESLGVKLSGVITCPSCSHQFLLAGDLDKVKKKQEGALLLEKQVVEVISKKQIAIEEINAKIDKIEESICAINTRQSEFNDNKNKLQQTVNTCNESLNTIKASLNTKETELQRLALLEKTRLSNIDAENEKLKSIDTKNKSTEEVISAKQDSIKLIEGEKKKLKVGNNKEVLKKLNTDLLTYRTEKSNLEIQQSELEEKIANKEQWMLNFKQFRMFLANKSLGVIEYHCNRYLQEMGSDLIVKVEGFKVLSDGQVREEITTRIVRNLNERNFKSFSGGERGRLLFASILANRFMINECHEHGGLDFLSIDEVFEGVDSEGLLSLIESAKLLQIPVLLITHVSVEEDDNVLTIVKENGISRIKY